MNAIIFGPPGSGKGTYASRLKKKLDVDVISMGDIFRQIIKENTPLGIEAKEYVEKGLLVPSDIVIRVLTERLKMLPPEKGFILDGYPRTIEQAKALEGITKIDVIFLQMVPDWIIVERLSSRRICKNCGDVYNIRFLKPKIENVCDKCGGSLYQRSDDRPEIIKRRIQVYQEQTRPILNYYKKFKVPFIVSSTTALETQPETVIQEIVKELRKQNLA